MGYVYRGKIRDVDEPVEVAKPGRVFDPAKCGTSAGYKQHQSHGVMPPGGAGRVSGSLLREGGSLMARIPHGESVTVPIKPGTPADWDNILHCTPGHEFVYVFRDAAKRVLYVGITWSAKARWRTHKRKQPWWFHVASAELTCCDSTFLALDVERRLIKELSPMHNIRSVTK